MNSSVMRAILAMDSYNRGYGQGVNGLSDTGALGQANLITIPDDKKTGWVAAGFYASAYNWNGRTVISYRGTNPETATSLWRDSEPRESFDVAQDRLRESKTEFSTLLRSSGFDPSAGLLHPAML